MSCRHVFRTPGRAAALAILVQFCAAVLPASAATLSAAQVSSIDRIAAKALAQQHVSGMAVGVGRNGMVLFARGYGLRDRANGLPVTAGTIFPVGSITKQFTSTCVMLLVQQGKVRLDSPVAQYLPNAPHAREITVRELLDQTSGLPDYLEDKTLYAAIVAGTTKNETKAQFVALINGAPLHFKPGTKWEYSNTNYALLGLLIEKVSGQPYERFVTDNILNPLDLRNTLFLTTFVPNRPDVTQGYNYVKNAFVAVRNYDMSWGNAAGALASTVSDLIRWDGAFYGGKVISPESVKIATTAPAGIPVIASKTPKNNIGQGYAFGWMDGQDEGRNLIWHNGGVIGGRAMNLVFPDDGLEIVVLTNASSGEPESTSLQIARMLYSSK
jgi:D-alanyl-D-alanine carboxypeptidase